MCIGIETAQLLLCVQILHVHAVGSRERGGARVGGAWCYHE